MLTEQEKERLNSEMKLLNIDESEESILR